MPKLSDEERHRILLKCSQIMGTHPAHPNSGFWAQLAAELGRDDLDAATLERVVSDLPTYMGRWYDYYSAQSSRRALHPLTPETREGLRSALQEGQVGIVCYFRILDSFPAGNANMRVYKFTLTPDPEFNLHHYLNLDGSAYHSGRTARLPMPTESALKQALLDPLVRLLDETPGQSVEVTVDDPQIYTSNPTEIWSSVEIMVFGPWSAVGPSEEPDDVFPPNPEFAIGGWPLVFHIHQRALCRNWHRNMGPGDQDVVAAPASAATKAVLDGAFELTGIETPQSNGPDSPIYLAFQKLGGFWNYTTELPGWGFYAMPIYLKAPHTWG